MQNNKENIINSFAKSIALSILEKEESDPIIIKKIINSIDNRNSYHNYINNKNPILINEYNLILMYLKEDDFLIKITDNYVEILFLQEDNVIIKLKWDHELNYYSVQYNIKKEARQLEIDPQKISFYKQTDKLHYRHTFEKKYHTEKDYELLSKLIIDAMGTNEIETEVTNYLNCTYPKLSKIIKNNIEYTKENP